MGILAILSDGAFASDYSCALAIDYSWVRAIDYSCTLAPIPVPST